MSYVMEIGISTASYFTRHFTEDCLVPIAQAGADVCEVFFATHSEYTPAFGEIMLQKLEEARKFSPLQIHSVHALTNQFEPELYSVNTRSLADAMQTYRNVLAIAKQVGAKYYTFHGATMLKRAVRYQLDYDRIAGCVNRLCDTAAEYGVQLCYENVHWAYFCTPEFFTHLRDKCPALGTVLDIKQAHQSGYDYAEYLQVMSDRLRTVHLCDIDSEGQVALPGKGILDFVTLFRRLADMGYQGPCMMEVYAKNYRSFDELNQSYLYLKDCLDRALQ